MDHEKQDNPFIKAYKELLNTESKAISNNRKRRKNEMYRNELKAYPASISELHVKFEILDSTPEEDSKELSQKIQNCISFINQGMLLANTKIFQELKFNSTIGLAKNTPVTTTFMETYAYILHAEYSRFDTNLLLIPNYVCEFIQEVQQPLGSIESRNTACKFLQDNNGVALYNYSRVVKRDGEKQEEDNTLTISRDDINAISDFRAFLLMKQYKPVTNLILVCTTWANIILPGRYEFKVEAINQALILPLELLEKIIKPFIDQEPKGFRENLHKANAQLKQIEEAEKGRG